MKILMLMLQILKTWRLRSSSFHQIFRLKLDHFTNIENPSFLIHFVSSNLNTDIKEKQQLLEMNNIQAQGRPADAIAAK